MIFCAWKNVHIIRCVEGRLKRKWVWFDWTETKNWRQISIFLANFENDQWFLIGWSLKFIENESVLDWNLSQAKIDFCAIALIGSRFCDWESLQRCQKIEWANFLESSELWWTERVLGLKSRLKMIKNNTANN